MVVYMEPYTHRCFVLYIFHLYIDILFYLLVESSNSSCPFRPFRLLSAAVVPALARDYPAYAPPVVRRSSTRLRFLSAGATQPQATRLVPPHPGQETALALRASLRSQQSRIS